MSATSLPVRALMMLVALCGYLALATAPAHADVDPNPGPDGALHTLELRGTLSPPMVAQLHGAIEAAVATGATALVVTLDTDGVISGDVSLLTPMLNAPVPVAIFIPPGGQAAGGGAVLAALADVLLVAPDATIGPALPFQLADGVQGSVDPVTEGLAEYNQLRRLLPAGVEEAGATAARLSVEALSAQQALDLGIAEGSAAERDAAIAALAGRTVDKRGATMTIHVSSTTPLVASSAGAADRLLVALATPGVGYLAIVGVALALLLFAFSRSVATPLIGLVLPLAGYSLVVLPARWWAIALLVAAVAALAWDVAAVWFGVPTLLGVALLATGSATLFSGVERLAVPVPLVVLACAVVIGLSLAARRRQDRDVVERHLTEVATDLEAARRVQVGLAREAGPTGPSGR